MHPDTRLLLLDGATGTELMEAGMPEGVCAELWALEHPEAVERLQRRYLDAGSQVLYTPTFGANAARLRAFGLQGRMAELNRTLAARTKRVAGDAALVAGSLSPASLAGSAEDLPFTELCDLYAEQAFALKEGGADLLVAETMLSLQQCRAAALGIRQAGLPFWVTVCLSREGRTLWDSDPVSVLIAMQRLGAQAFGFNCSEPQLIGRALRQVAPYAKIPLVAKPCGGKPGERMSPAAFAAAAEPLLLDGATRVGGCCQAGPEQIAALGGLLAGFDQGRVRIERYCHPLTAVCADQPFFLEEDFVPSPPIRCQADMAEAIIAVEDAGYGAITVRLDSVEDAWWLAENAHMARLPILLDADCDEALEFGLLLYEGCAIINSDCEIQRAVLEELAAGYGAVLV